MIQFNREDGALEAPSRLPADDGARSLAEAPAAEAGECGFEDIRMQIGDALQLQSGAERYYVRLIGYLPGASVQVTTPTVEGRVLLLREGQVFIARSFSGRSAYAFNTAVARVCNAPFPYLHLQYPKAVQGVPVRRETRARVRVVASVTRPHRAGEPVPAVISDLSPSGARVDARDMLAAKGEQLGLSFRMKFEQEDAYFCCAAVVRSVREEKRAEEASGMGVLHGVEFLSLPTNERLLLRTLILQRLAEGGQAES